MDPDVIDNEPQYQRYPMQKYPVDGQVFKSLVEAGLTWLKTNQQTVNMSQCFSRTGWRYWNEYGINHAGCMR